MNQRTTPAGSGETSRGRRILLRSLVVFMALAGVLGAYTWLHWSSAAAPYTGDDQWAQIPIELPLRGSSAHDAALARNGGEPYTLSIDAPGSGAILYYGATHSQSADHPQIADIEARWNAFQPTVALAEGRSRGYFFGGLIEPFAGLPEPALVHKLASRDGVTLYSLEPSYADEVAALLDEFTPEQIALHFFLRVYISEAGGVANESLATDLLRKRTDVDGLRESLPSIAALDRLWERDFAHVGNWRSLTDEPQGGYIGRVSAASRRTRGEHMIRTLTDLARKGERVFAVVGSGHVVRQEWNLRALFGLESAWDQPQPGT